MAFRLADLGQERECTKRERERGSQAALHEIFASIEFSGEEMHRVQHFPIETQ
jgi:hypothetical protein